MPDFRIIPSVEQLRQRAGVQRLLGRYGHAAVVQALRDETDALRRRLAPGALDAAGAPLPATAEDAAAQIERGLEPRLQRMFHLSLRPVINATGVIVHTNLGRAPLSDAALAAVAAVGRRYSTLEYDVESGGRGHRDVHAEALLCQVTGAEAAAVVNNCAAATLLTLAALAAGREVIVSRGELVEIGGGFRVPDVMAQSGAVLREVGTTNRTRAADYAAAVTDRTALILRVHRSNFRIEGFTETPALDDLVAVGRAKGVPVAEDLGSGNVAGGLAMAAAAPGASPDAAAGLHALLGNEPTVQDSVAAGVDIICVSGDKLLGGPQAGIILGRRDLVEQTRRHQLMRALRVDKLTYAALAGTLVEYLAGRARGTIPVLRMLTATAADVQARARRVGDRLEASGLYDVRIVDGESAIGGGTTPGLSVPTRLLAVTHRYRSPDALEDALRRSDPPVIARIEDDALVLDLRTVFEDEDEPLAQALASIA
jgi:L-seryl-tRNA(Ser) seleniumtransferase